MATGSTQSAGPAPANRLQTAENGESHPFAELLERPVVSTSIYDKINDPLSFVKEMGKAFSFAGVAGCKSPSEGECLAWALLEMKKNWVEFAGEYHMVLGKPTLQAHAILARIRRAGGKFRWINDGDDLKEASAEFTIDGVNTVVKYSMNDAIRAKIQGFEKADSAWQRSPSAMLRAAMSRKAAKMLCPEVLTGDVDPEEFSDDSHSAATTTAAPVATRTPEETEARRKELLASADPTGVATVTADPNATTTAAVEAAKPVEQKPSPLSGDDLQLGATIDEIVAVAKALNMPSREALEGALKQSNPSFAGLESLGLKGSESLLTKLKANLPDGHPLKK